MRPIPRVDGYGRTTSQLTAHSLDTARPYAEVIYRHEGGSCQGGRLASAGAVMLHDEAGPGAVRPRPVN